MKQSFFITIVYVLAAAVGYTIYVYTYPPYIQAGGIVIIALTALSIVVLTFAIERTLFLRKAEGKKNLSTFFKELEQLLAKGDLDPAIEHCKVQSGSFATVMQTGLERYADLQKQKRMDVDRQVIEVQRVIEESSSLQVPLLEKNLPALSTIASVATMLGLLGTVTGMIRSFQAMASTGSSDAVQLSLGISEALVTTAGGLIVGITSLVAFNYFANKVDTMTFMLDEAVFNIVQMLNVHEER
ncbi:MAG: MotA/TolQ/ExbB proton channel family protein [Bacteroidota bacterium]